MKPSDNHMDRAWVEDRIEAYTDGLLSKKEKKVFEAMVEHDDALAREVALARRLQRSLGDLPNPVCPPSAYEPVLEMARRHSEDRSREPLTNWIRSLASTLLTPTRVVVTAAVVIAIVIATLVVDRGAVEPAHDPSEVQAALQEVRLALSYVSLAGRETGDVIRNRAVDETLIRPIQRAIDQAEIGSARTRRHRGDETGAAHTTRGES